jgi:hypothetical protein
MLNLKLTCAIQQERQQQKGVIQQHTEQLQSLVMETEEQAIGIEQEPSTSTAKEDHEGQEEQDTRRSPRDTEKCPVSDVSVGIPLDSTGKLHILMY